MLSKLLAGIVAFLIVGLILPGSNAFAFGKKSDICTAANNYCRGGSTSNGSSGGGSNQRQWEQEQEMLRQQRQREEEARERKRNRQKAHAAEEEGRRRAGETERKLRQEQAEAAGQLKGGGSGQLQIRSGTAVMGLKDPNPTGSLSHKGPGAGSARSISREWKQAHCGMWIAGFAFPAARKGDVGETRYLRDQSVKVFNGGSAELGCPATPPPPEVVGRAVTGKDSPFIKFQEAVLDASVRQAEKINEANKTLLLARIRKSSIEKEVQKYEKKAQQLELEVKQAEAKKQQVKAVTTPEKDEAQEKKKRLLAEAMAALKKAKKAAAEVDTMVAKSERAKQAAEAKLTAYGELSQQAQAKPSIAGKLIGEIRE